MSPSSADPADASATLVPILDDDKRIVDVKVRPEAGFLPVAEPDLSHSSCAI